MKNIFFIPLSFISLSYSFSQPGWINTITFENNSQLISIDTSQVNNIWQIGKPQKIFFDSAFSKPNAIVTDTINSYPINNLSSFQLVIKEPMPNTWGIATGAVPFLSIYHKFDMDSLKDGGYIEVSYDGGTTWINTTNAPKIFWFNPLGGPPDTIPGGIRAFTGKSRWFNNPDWTYGYMNWQGWCNLNPSQIIMDSIIMRFTFKSDIIQTNKEGWMIDDIIYGTRLCIVRVNDLLENDVIKFYPNPIHTSATFQLNHSMFKKEIHILWLYNVFGEKVREEKFSSSEFIFERNNLPEGIYFYNIFGSKNKEAESVHGKIIIQ